MNFITLDFETATSMRNSACEIGLTWVNNGVIIRTESHLIQPPENDYDWFNTGLHGIGASDTATAPTFDQIWPSIYQTINQRIIVAHNTGFDMSVLRHTLDYYEVEHPNFEFACSYALSKRVWPGKPSYKLDSLCADHGIELAHHRAGPDSLATAELTLCLLKSSDVNSIHELVANHSYKMGKISPNEYSGCLAKRIRGYRHRPSLKIIGDPSKHQLESPFYGHGIVFTGKMSSMTRNEAKQLVADIGANVQSGVNGKTSYLVVGQQDYRVVGDTGMSNKQRDAIELCRKGQEIEVLSEVEFLRML